MWHSGLDLRFEEQASFRRAKQGSGMPIVRLHLHKLLPLLFLLPSAAASQTVDPTPSAAGPPHECRKWLPYDSLRGQRIAPTLMKFTITAEGAVKDVSVEQSSGNDGVDNAAMRCASRWLYHPATRNGTPVEVPWEARVNWMTR